MQKKCVHNFYNHTQEALLYAKEVYFELLLFCKRDLTLLLFCKRDLTLFDLPIGPNSSALWFSHQVPVVTKQQRVY